MINNPILNIKNLNIFAHINGKAIQLLNNVSLKIFREEVVGLVGESGSGKTITAFSTIKLFPESLKFNAESIEFNGKNIMEMHKKELEKIRGKEIAFIFQDPMSALNPLLKIKTQLEEVLIEHSDLDAQQRKEKIIEILKELDFPEPERKIRQYPHQLSGGLRQRVLIAMAILTNPSLIVADEPTTALDVTTQAKSLHLLKKMKEKVKSSILFISHDLYLLSKIADRIYVMYAGEVVEAGPSEILLKNPKHPYTQGLIDAIPIPGAKKKIKPIPGTIPDPGQKPSGCIFSTRCSFAQDKCFQEKPELVEKNNHAVKCFYPLKSFR